LTVAAATLTLIVGPAEAVGMRITLSDVEGTVRTLRANHKDGPSCFRPEPAVHLFFGTATEVCVFGGTEGSVLLRTDSPGHGLLYDPGPHAPGVQSICVNHVFGPWWEIADFDNEASCPRGFSARGGG
jgi:hypothetical protein